jgi:hypothetical protein
MNKRTLTVLLNQTRALQRRLRRVTPSGAAQLTTAIGELVELRRLAGRRKPKTKRKAKARAARTRKRAARAPKRATRLTERTFLAALDRVARRSPRDALHLVRVVRAELPGVSKEAFDRMALELARRDVVLMHHHDYAASLTPSEREALVTDGRGTHYIGIARRGK